MKRVQRRINVDCLRDEIRRSPTIASMSNFPKIQAIRRRGGREGRGDSGRGLAARSMHGTAQFRDRKSDVNNSAR